MEYAVHILTIKLWEWEAIKDRTDMSIIRSGPNQNNCNANEMAEKRIKELKEAIKALTPPAIQSIIQQ